MNSYIKKYISKENEAYKEKTYPLLGKTNIVRNFFKKYYNVTTIGMILVLYVVIIILQSTGNLSSLISGLLVSLCVYVILAISLNLTVGILGELSLGHAGFMCVGAFLSSFFSVLTKDMISDIPRFIIAIIIAFVFALLFGILIGIPVLRLEGDYLAIVTLAFGEIIKNVVNALYIGKDASGLHFSIKDSASLNLDETGEIIVNGAQGITGTPRSATFTIGIILVIISLLIIINLINSRAGRAIMATRDNHIAASVTGINITKYKLLAFSISAGLAGIAGALYSHNFNTLNGKTFDYNMSILVLVFVVLGGIGKIRGCIVATIILKLLPELLRAVNDFRMLIYAVVLILMMLLNWSPIGKKLKESFIEFIKFIGILFIDRDIRKEFMESRKKNKTFKKEKNIKKGNK